MLKTIIMALLIFAGMVGYDNFVDKQKPEPPPTQQEQRLPAAEAGKEDKHKEKAIKAIFFAMLPPQEEWPEPIQNST